MPVLNTHHGTSPWFQNNRPRPLTSQSPVMKVSPDKVAKVREVRPSGTGTSRTPNAERVVAAGTQCRDIAAVRSVDVMKSGV